MRGGVAVALLLGALVVVVSPAGAGARWLTVAVPAMTVSAAPQVASAHAVRLEVTLRYQMQCGYPGKGPLRVTFPSAMSLPQSFASRAVRLNGKRIAARVKGRRVSVSVPPPKGVLCNTIGPGSVTLAFTRAAKLRNPSRPGSYGFRATHAGHSFTAKLPIKPA
ncbi:MAG TPA: hypothetical protein VH063_19980 [Gaiellaceae bacterium]|jgi:hypothetical protein|nr:hypothetical protein [Gaiellaceae bacterium]